MNFLRFVLTPVSAMLVLSGCTTAPMRAPNEYASAIEYTDALYKHWPTLSYSSVPPKTPDGGTYRAYVAVLCSSPRFSLADQIEKPLANYCAARGGRYAAGVCVPANAAKGQGALFAVSMATSTCFMEEQTPVKVSIKVLEPSGNPADPADPAYTSARFAMGALTPAEQAQRDTVTAARDRKIAEAAAAKLAMELPYMRKRGAQVCQSQGRATLMGYVEDFSEEKLQIRVADCSYGPGLRCNFRAEILWDYPDNWHLCNG